MTDANRCPGCGRAANARHSRCIYCGTALAAAAAAERPAAGRKSCGRCGQVHGAALAMCPFCGARESGAPAATASAANDYAALAEQAISAVRPFVDLDWHASSALVLDVFFDQNWGGAGLAPDDDDWRPSEAQRRAIVLCGAFFGELLRRRTGGSWCDDPDRGNDPVVARLVLPGGVAIFPVSRAWRRMQNGASDGFDAMHEHVRRMCGSGAVASEAAGWVDRAIRFLDVHRGDLAVRFLDRAAALAADAAIRARIELLRERARQDVTADGAGDAPDPPPQSPSVSSAAAPAPRLAGTESRIPADLAAALVDARDATQRGDHAAALAALDRALDVEPASKEAILGRAGALLGLGRALDARRWLEDFAPRTDCEPVRTFLAAIAADDADDAPAAHELFTRSAADERLGAAHRDLAAQRSSELAGDPRVLGRAVERAPDVPGAVREWERICAAHPSYVEGHCELGVGLSILGRTDEAIAAFDRAIELAPTQRKPHDHKAALLARVGRTADAVAVLDAGLRHCPGDVGMTFRRGALLAGLGRSAEARDAFAAVVRADPSHADVWGNLADLALREGRTADAVAALRAFLANNANRLHPRIDAARRRLWELEHPGARRDPESAATQLAVAVDSMAARDVASALVALDSATAADPLCGDAWLHRGSCLAALGRAADAIESFERAESLLGATRAVCHGQVEALLSLGRGDDALRAHARQLSRGAPSDPDHLDRARTLVRLGRLADALPVLRRLAGRNPADGEIRELWNIARAAVADRA